VTNIFLPSTTKTKPMKFCLLLTSFIIATSCATAQSSIDAGPVTANGFGENIVSVSPFLINNTGPGFGICYERFLEESSTLSIYIPLTFTFQKLAWHYHEQYKTQNAGGMLGFKFYPATSKGVVKYAFSVGISQHFITRHYQHYTKLHTGALVEENKTVGYAKTGFLIGNTVNFTIAKKIVLALDLHLGFAASNEPDYDGTVPFALVMFKTGYRF
jgi:hypothetical protein